MASPEERQALLARLPASERLAGLPASERLAGVSPEERLAGLTPEQRAALARLLQADLPPPPGR